MTVVSTRNIFHGLLLTAYLSCFVDLTGLSPDAADPPTRCGQRSCFPLTGDLLTGREGRLTASSTCGMTGQQRYCEASNRCFTCDAANPRWSHRIDSVVTRARANTYVVGPSSSPTRSWWQAENGIENVTVQFDLETEFHFYYLIITFKSARPAGMILEKSNDYGRTWQVYKYFAANCSETFPRASASAQSLVTDVVCESKYSAAMPATDGEVQFQTLPANIFIDDPYSPEVQNWLKITNLRINFTKLHATGVDLSDTRPETQGKHYYAISEMVVHGTCLCYGHASSCLPLPGLEHRTDMVHARCQCTHNTTGINCESCADMFYDRPWKPAVGKQLNACKRCECNNHSSSCHFDASVYELGGRTSGGVCDECANYTTGIHCEQCHKDYYLHPGKESSDADVCQKCDCDRRGTRRKSIHPECDPLTNAIAGEAAFRCRCKANVEGHRCDKCKLGKWIVIKNKTIGCESDVPECGKRNINSALLAGGQEATEGEFPWHAGLYWMRNGKYRQFCSGTLIKANIVITAAHCVFDERFAKLRDKSIIRVVLGKLLLDWDVDLDNKAVQRFEVVDVVIKQWYRGRRTDFRYDIAILKLSEEAVFTRHVNAACVDWNNAFTHVQLAPGNNGTVSGWGLTFMKEGSSPSLMWVDLPWVDADTCHAATPIETTGYLTNDKFCAGFVNQNTSVCPGDSGAGLLFLNASSNRYYLRGVVSTNLVRDAHPTLCDAQLYTTFTALSDYTSWIKKYFVQQSIT